MMDVYYKSSFSEMDLAFDICTLALNTKSATLVCSLDEEFHK